MKQIYKLSTHFVCFLVAVFCFQQFASGQVTISVSPNPSPIVSMQNATFTVTVSNNGITLTNLTLEAVATSPGFTVTPVTTQLISELHNGMPVTLQFNVLPGCSAPQGTGRITYTLKNSSNVQVGTAAQTDPIIVQIPQIVFTKPANKEIPWAHATQEYTRVFALESTLPPQITHARVVNTCNKTTIKITKLELVTNISGTSVIQDITATALDATSLPGGYVYNFGATVFSKIGNLDGIFNENEKFFVRETFKVVPFDVTNNDLSSTYTYGYGNSSDYCLSGNEKSYITIRVPNIGPDIATVAGVNPPYSSTVPAVLRLAISNTVGTPTDPLLDVLVRVWWIDLLRFNVKNVYFSNQSDGLPVPGAPALTFTNNTAILPCLVGENTANAKAWVVSFDGLNNPANAALYESLGLSNATGDGVWNDIMPGKTVYITVEYDFDPWVVTTDCPGLLYASTRRANLFYKNNDGYYKFYTRASSGLNSTYYSIGGVSFNPPYPSEIIPINLKPGDDATLRLTEKSNLAQNGAGSENSAYMGSTVNFDHYVVITLPEDFDYDAMQQGVTITDIPCPISNVAKSIDGDGRVVLTILNKSTATVNASNLYYKIKMTAKNTITNNSAKNCKIEHRWAYLGESKYFKLGCFENIPADYHLITPFQNMTLETFSAQRMTFGWTNPAKTTRIDLSNIHLHPNVDRTVAGPFDNVDITGTIKIDNNFSIGAATWFFDMGYDGISTPYFSFPDATHAVEVKRNGTTLFFIPESSITKITTPISGGNRHLYRLNLSSYSGLQSLSPSDIITLTFKMRTVENLGSPIHFIQDFYQQTYLDAGAGAPENKNILGNNEFRIVDYKTNDNRDVKGVLNENYTDSISYLPLRLRTDLHPMSGSNFFPNEFRPNQTLKKATFTIDNIVEISRITAIETRIGFLPFYLTTELAPADYQVTYSGNKTIVVINKNLEFQHFNALQCIFINLYVKMDCPNENPFTTSIDFTYYPSSEAPKNGVFTIGSRNMFNVFRYQYNIKPVAAIVYPQTNHAVWDFTLQNTSSWRVTDDVLPNSWLAVEYPTSVPLSSLALTSADGITTYSPFYEYAPGKAWVKMGDLNVYHTKDFKISCDYFTCDPFQIKITYAMNPYEYPNHPDDATYKRCPVKVTETLKAETGARRVYGEVINPIPNGIHEPDRYRFCLPHTFTVNFLNGENTELYNPVLQILLNTGFELDQNSFVATINTLSPTPVAIASIESVDEKTKVPVDINNTAIERLAIVKFAPGTYLRKYEEVNGNKMEVKFDLRPVCNFVSGSKLYVDFMVDNGCGSITGEKKESTPFFIDGIPVTSNFDIYNYNVTGALDLSSVGGVTASGVQVTATVEVAAPQADYDNYVALLVPQNMTLTNNNAHAFVLTPKMERGNQVFYYSIPASYSVNQTFDVDVTLKPTNPENWTCEDVFVCIYTFAMLDKECDNIICDVPEKHGNDKDQFLPVSKNSISFHHVAAEGSYHNATTEKVTFSGSLNVPYNANMSGLLVEIYTNASGTLVPVAGNPAFTIPTIITDATTNIFSFESTTPVYIPAADMCHLYLKINRTSYPYICEDAAYVVDHPNFSLLKQTPYLTCAETEIEIGDANPISGYTYKWTPTDHIIGANDQSQIKVKFDADDEYHLFLDVERIGGCHAQTGVTIIVNPIHCCEKPDVTPTSTCD